MKEKNKKGIKKRLFSVVLALAMVLSLMPMNTLTVFAESVEVSTFEALKTAISNGGELKLTQGIASNASEELTVNEGKTVTIDLNGHNINLGGSYIRILGTLTIIDTSEAKSGTISGASVNGSSVINVGNGSSSGTPILNLYGGTITGNTTSFYGGGIFKYGYATLNVGGSAKVIGNKAKEYGTTDNVSNVHFQNNVTTGFNIITTGDHAIVTIVGPD